MKRIVLTFGRFNPPTVGHQKLLEAVKRIAGSDDYHIYVSHSQDKKKNPLASDEKVKLMKKMFPSMSSNIIYDPSLKTIINVLQKLQGQYYDVTMVVGSDRVDNFKSLIEKYNGVEYTFRSLDVVSAGERDPDADDVSGMSASKMRAAAIQSDFKTFRSGMPNTISDAEVKKIMQRLTDIMMG